MNNKREPVIDAQGRHRGYKLWIECPNCLKGRWVREDGTRSKTFTGFCQLCHAQFTTGQFDKHSMWKGGSVKTKGGYIEIKLRNDDPYYPMAKKSGYVREHRLVMAKHLGRCLESWEIVHHKNGIRDDNRLENLELITCGVYHLLDLNYKGQLTRAQNRAVPRKQ